MGFRMTFRDTHGAEKLAQVSLFLVRQKQLVALYNLKSDATPEAAQAARDELQNFVELVGDLQNTGRALFADVGDGEMQNLSEINLSQTKLVTRGPKGGVAVGFDEEEDLSEDQITQLAEEMIARHQAARAVKPEPPPANPFTVFDLQ